MHVSGHASGPELLDMIREIQPEILYPVHTIFKERFKVLEDDGINVIYPKLSKNL
jgi:ribonuclease J